MARRWGLGPVFALEWLTTSRRWQVYAGRVLFVGGLLLALACVWLAQVAGRPGATIREQANTGQSFFRAIVTTQYILILIVTPSALAGVICQDRGRGDLVHLLLTDLSNAEIVLGKLAGRLVPVLGMVACSLPVLALGTLLGGIDPRALAGAFVVAVATAILCGSIAMAFSTWGTKTHEVILATMGVEAIWLLFTPIWWFLAAHWARSAPPRWAMAIEPFDLAMGFYYRPDEVGWIDFAGYCGACLAISAGLIALSVARIRAVTIAGMDGSRPRSKKARDVDRTRHLDRDPAGWHERHRRRLTPWMRKLIAVYFAFAVGFGGLAIQDGIWPLPTNNYGWFPGYVVGFASSFGLALIVLTAATATADERSRGSLDVLLTTPLPTRQIVLAKWWGAFRHVGMLLVVPTAVALPLAWTTGRWGIAALVPISIVAWAASASSVGLLISTWSRRPARAVTTAVTLYMLVAIGWPIVVMSALSDSLGGFWGFTIISPFYGAFFATLLVGKPLPYYAPGADWFCGAGAFLHAVTAAVGLLTVLATFDRALGRVPDRARRPAGGNGVRRPPFRDVRRRR